MNKALAYILGFAFGDGNISKSSYLVRLYEQNQQFVETTLRSRFARSFGSEPTITFDKYNNSFVLYKSSKSRCTAHRFIDGLHDLLVEISDEFKPRVYHYDYGSILRLNGKEQLKLVSSCLHLMHPRFSPPARRSRNTGQGVSCHGEPKGSKPGGKAKAILRKAARPQGGGPKGPFSHGGLD